MNKEDGKALIHVDNLSHTFGGRNADLTLDKVTAVIRPGDFVALVGTNGSGKSTLARHLNALLLPSSGSVRVDGMDSANPENKWEIRRRVGMVFQNPDNQSVAATVREDVAFGPENLGVAPAEVQRRVAAVLARVGLEHLAERPPHTLSGGEKQLLAIGGVLAMNPQCIVLDEPTSMLDPGSRSKIMDLLVEINRKQGIAVVLVTHFMEEAALAGWVWVMYSGRLVLDGTPEEVFAHPDKIERLGLELPPARRLAALLAQRGLQLPREEEAVSLNKLMDQLLYALQKR